MKPKEENVEYKILKAAEKLFLEKGFMRTTTSQIAKEAGCNQAMVHYYYRTKELLFEKIYGEKIRLMMSNLLAISSTDESFEEKISNIINAHFDFLKENPLIPAFLLNEMLHHSSGKMTQLTEILKEHLQAIIIPLENELQKEIKKGTIHPISSIDLMLTIISLNIAPFLIAPVFQNIWNLSDKEFADLLECRKKEVIQTIFSRLKK